MMKIIPDLLGAIDLAANRHSAQRRKGPCGPPYINHLIEVVFLLSDTAKIEDRDTLIAAILHDIVEDTSTTLDEIADRFGVRVREIVNALSDDKSLPKEERKRLILVHLPNADTSVKLIKLADLISNISSVPSDWTKERLHDYFDWSRQAALLCAGVSGALDDLFLNRWHASFQAAGLNHERTGT